MMNSIFIIMAYLAGTITGWVMCHRTAMNRVARAMAGVFTDMKDGTYILKPTEGEPDVPTEPKEADEVLPDNESGDAPGDNPNDTGC
jgi:hypothetical protein